MPRMPYRLRRRGVDHGTVTPVARERRWERSEPELLKGAVDVRSAKKEIAASLKLLADLRQGGELAPRLGLPPGYRVAGVSQNTEDPLEMQKVHVEGGGRELYVKANWLSTHPGDGSLRLRFSHGAEILDDWLDDPTGARASERLFDATFPESRLVTENAALAAELRKRLGSSPRYVQRILYANQPDGGALFHHDYVPKQQGVVYAQLAGTTGWVSCSKRALARNIQEATGRWHHTQALLDHLDSPDQAKVLKLINHTGSFTRKLAAEGWFFVVRPGDVVLLPSQGWDDVAWHEVFTLSKGGNLSLSFGVVAR